MRHELIVALKASKNNTTTMKSSSSKTDSLTQVSRDLFGLELEWPLDTHSRRLTDNPRLAHHLSQRAGVRGCSLHASATGEKHILSQALAPGQSTWWRARWTRKAL